MTRDGRPRSARGDGRRPGEKPHRINGQGFGQGTTVRSGYPHGLSLSGVGSLPRSAGRWPETPAAQGDHDAAVAVPRCHGRGCDLRHPAVAQDRGRGDRAADGNGARRHRRRHAHRLDRAVRHPRGGGAARAAGRCRGVSKRPPPPPRRPAAASAARGECPPPRGRAVRSRGLHPRDVQEAAGGRTRVTDKILSNVPIPSQCPHSFPSPALRRRALERAVPSATAPLP